MARWRSMLSVLQWLHNDSMTRRTPCFVDIWSVHAYLWKNMVVEPKKNIDLRLLLLYSWYLGAPGRAKLGRFWKIYIFVLKFATSDFLGVLRSLPTVAVHIEMIFNYLFELSGWSLVCKCSLLYICFGRYTRKTGKTYQMYTQLFEIGFTYCFEYIDSSWWNNFHL